MRYYECDKLSSRERDKLERKGLYCYDLRLSDDGSYIATIEKNVIVNNCGSIITDREIEFKDFYDFVDYDDFVSNNDYVEMFELLNKRNYCDNTIKIRKIGVDSWERPVYKDEKGRIYKDINLGIGKIDLYSVINNSIYGEPFTKITGVFKIIPKREIYER